jgi:hypothetical protein
MARPQVADGGDGLLIWREAARGGTPASGSFFHKLTTGFQDTSYRVYKYKLKKLVTECITERPILLDLMVVEQDIYPTHYQFQHFLNFY